MPLTDTEILQLESLLAASDGGPQLVQEFREHFPGRSLTRCDESDMGGEEPFRCFDALNVYLVDGREHCWHITSDPQLATGVVVARRRRRA